jgi:hypothetical protein
VSTGDRDPPHLRLVGSGPSTPAEPLEEIFDALSRATAKLGEDELRVLTYIAERLVVGAQAYGDLDIATDRRDWKRERGEEAADLLVYSAIDSLKRDLEERAALERFLAILRPTRRPAPDYGPDHTIHCRVCDGPILPGEPELHRVWRVDSARETHAHPACGWLRPDEREPHIIASPFDRFARWQWACPRCRDVVVAEKQPVSGAGLRCAACARMGGESA